MFRPRLLLTSLAIALGACTPQADPQVSTTKALAQQVLLPAYQRWAEADRQLAESAHAYCSGQQSLEQARQAFFGAQQAWAQLQPLLVGPLAEGNRTWQVQFYPDKKNLVARQVEQLLTRNEDIDDDVLQRASVVVQGLSAYEYILFDSNIELADAAQKARYCPLLQAIGRHQQSLAAQILDDWNLADSGVLAQLSQYPNERYADAQEAIAELLRAQTNALDTLKKKLGAPLGRLNKGIPQPYQAEAWRSGASLASLEASLAGARSLWQGVDGQGLRDLLGKDQAELAQRIDAAYENTLQLLQAIKPPLGERVATAEGRAELDRLYDSLNVLHRLHQGELAKALGIQIGFNANDGD